MDFEPNKASFFERLKAADFNPSTLINDAQALQEILWYLAEERTGEIVTEILTPEKTKRTEAEQIITNLAKLYPLSGSFFVNLMTSLLRPNYPDGKKLYLDAEFLDGYDVAKKMRDEIVATFNQVDDRISHLTKEVRDYRHSLERLTADKAALERQTEALRSIAEERDAVQAQVEQLRIDTDEKRLKQQIDDLNAEKKQLEINLSDHKSKVAQHEKIIGDLRTELKYLEQHPNSDDELDLIKELFKKFPKDAED